MGALILILGSRPDSESLRIGATLDDLINRHLGRLPSDTETNPRDQCHSITTRNGLTTQSPKLLRTEPKSCESEEQSVEFRDKLTQSGGPSAPFSVPVPVYQPLPPFPQRFQNKKLDAQFSKFLNIF